MKKFQVHPHIKRLPLLTISLAIFLVLCLSVLAIYIFETNINKARSETEYSKLTNQFLTTKKDFEILKNTDQIKRNDALEDTIKKVQASYDDAVLAYEQLLDLPVNTKDISSYHQRFATILKYLADKNYASASAVTSSLKSDITKANDVTLSQKTETDLSNIPSNLTPPNSGFSQQKVDTNGSSFLVDLIAGNLSNTKVIVDTASDNDCTNDCPTLSLATYIARNGAYAGVNGSYFCPSDYPSCAGKTNTFDTLAMNVKKHYFNSDNNIYSSVPAVIFGNGSVRFVDRSQDWGRDTSVDGVLANQPLLVSGGNVVFGGDTDPKKGSRGNRSFVANKGNTVYIGVVFNVTVAQSALVMKALGMDNALNLDSGGSTALWISGGYKAGPGRNLPNVILFVKK